MGQAGLFADIFEPYPAVLGSSVLQQDLVAVEGGKKDIRPTVVVIVGGGDPFYEFDDGTTRLLGHFGKRPILIIDKQLAGMLLFVGGRLIPDKDVQPAVIVKIRPNGRLGGMETEQPAFFRNVRECPVPIV